MCWVNATIFRTATGRQIGVDKIDAEYWCQHLRQPVRFADGLQSLDELGVDVFLEIGPKPTLIGIGRQCLSTHDRLWLNSLCYGKDDWAEMLDSLGQLAVKGVQIDWVEFDRDYVRQDLSLPTYPFQRKSYWIDPPAQLTDLNAVRDRQLDFIHLAIEVRSIARGEGNRRYSTILPIK